MPGPGPTDWRAARRFSCSACSAAISAQAYRPISRLRALASELTLAEHRERRRIAQILHDHLRQVLVAAKLRLMVLGRSGDGKNSQAATEIAALLEESLAVSRSLTAELSPPILNEAGWTPALACLARSMAEKHGLTVELAMDPDLPLGVEMCGCSRMRRFGNCCSMS